MKLITWNVNGVRARSEQVAALVGREQPDVLCLQEIKVAPDHLVKEIAEVPGYWCTWHGTKGYSGVALHVRQGFAPTCPVITHPPFDFETRVAVAELPELVVASIYAPNGGKDFPAKLRFFEALVTWAGELRAAGRAVLLCGDLNIARAEIDVHPSERNPRLTGQLPEERALFQRLLDAGGLHDLGRQLDPTNDALYSWWAPWRNMRARNIGWRLDYVLASDGLAARATSCPALREEGTSDHAPVIATFAEGAGSLIEPVTPADARPPGPPYLVVSDFDGTITVDDLTNLVWDRHLPYDWRAVLTPLSREGVLSPLEMIAQGYGDVPAAPEALLAEILLRGRLRAGWAAFVSTCDARAWPLEVLSHGLTFYIRPLLPPGVALTAFEGTFEGGRWRVDLPAGLTVPVGRDFKAHVVSLLRARHPGHTTVYVGDGRLDFPAARTCDRVFAVADSTLARLCGEASVAFTPFETFDEIIAALADVTADVTELTR